MEMSLRRYLTRRSPLVVRLPVLSTSVTSMTKQTSLTQTIKNLVKK